MTISYAPNPLVDVTLVLHETSDEPDHINVNAYSATRGFRHARLQRGEGPAFDVAWRFLDRSDDDRDGCADLAAPERAMLHEAGLIVAEGERGPAFRAMRTLPAAGAFDRDGFVALPECLTPAACAAVIAHYRERIDAGALDRGDRQSDRFNARNDPAARVVQRQFEALVERIVGRPIQCSYTYASLYCGGAALPRHRDRLQSEYVLSLLIDADPLSASGGSPAPLQLFVDPDGPPVICDQPLGGGVLFRGRRIPHGRAALPAEARSWAIVLNYVDADFDSSLD